MNTMPLTLFATILILIAPSVDPVGGSDAIPSSHASDPGEQLQLTVGFSESLPHPTARAMLIRPVGSAPPVLVVTEETTGSDLARGLHLLAISYQSHGKVMGRELRTFVMPQDEGRQNWEEETDLLDRLRNTSSTSEDRFGILRSVSVVMLIEQGRYQAIVASEP